MITSQLICHDDECDNNSAMLTSVISVTLMLMGVVGLLSLLLFLLLLLLNACICLSTRPASSSRPATSNQRGDSGIKLKVEANCHIISCNLMRATEKKGRKTLTTYKWKRDWNVVKHFNFARNNKWHKHDASVLESLWEVESWEAQYNTCSTVQCYLTQRVIRWPMTR